MPFYEYRCEICDRRFELRRPASEAGSPATCPDGHHGARRLISVFATAGRAGSSEVPAPVGGAGGGGGCCGGACGCRAR